MLLLELNEAVWYSLVHISSINANLLTFPLPPCQCIFLQQYYWYVCECVCMCVCTCRESLIHSKDITTKGLSVFPSITFFANHEWSILLCALEQIPFGSSETFFHQLHIPSSSSQAASFQLSMCKVFPLFLKNQLKHTFFNLIFY